MTHPLCLHEANIDIAIHIQEIIWLQSMYSQIFQLPVFYLQPKGHENTDIFYYYILIPTNFIAI